MELGVNHIISPKTENDSMIRLELTLSIDFESTMELATITRSLLTGCLYDLIINLHIIWSSLLMHATVLHDTKTEHENESPNVTSYKN